MLRLIVGDGLMLAGIGVGIGLVLAPMGTYFGQSLFYNVGPFDPATFTSVATFSCSWRRQQAISPRFARRE